MVWSQYCDPTLWETMGLEIYQRGRSICVNYPRGLRFSSITHVGMAESLRGVVLRLRFYRLGQQGELSRREFRWQDTGKLVFVQGEAPER